MSVNNFQELVEQEMDAFIDHMTGQYSSKKRDAWVESREASDKAYWSFFPAIEETDDT